MKQMHWMIVGCCVSLVLAGTAAAQRPDRPGGPGRGRTAEGELDVPPVAGSDFEKKVYSTLDEMKQGPRYLNVSATDGRLLRMLSESIGAKNIVEIGTSTGDSAIWFALALPRPADICSRTKSTPDVPRPLKKTSRKRGSRIS